MNRYKALLVGSAITVALTVALGGLGTWIARANADHEDLIEIKAILPQMQKTLLETRDDTKETRLDIKDMNTRLSNIEGQLRKQ